MTDQEKAILEAAIPPKLPKTARIVNISVSNPTTVEIVVTDEGNPVDLDEHNCRREIDDEFTRRMHETMQSIIEDLKDYYENPLPPGGLKMPVDGINGTEARRCRLKEYMDTRNWFLIGDPTPCDLAVVTSPVTSINEEKGDKQ